jgi:hypothetical protein
MPGRRFAAAIAAFLVLFSIADLSRTGLCQDSECAGTTVPAPNGISQPGTSHTHSSGEGCFCCNTTLVPASTFQIESLRLQEALFFLIPGRTLTLWHPPLDHIPL